MSGEDAGLVREIAGHQKALYHFALTLTGNAQDAMDLTQETILKALRNRSSFRAGTNLRAWLVRIMRNTFIDQRRRKRYEPLPAEEVDGRVEAPFRTDEEELTEVFPDELARAFKALDPAQRALLVLADLHGFSYKEITEIMDIPMGTCMSRIHRARSRLRERILQHRRAREAR